jgi:outer membrane receptor for ferrienterochelin and colicin
MKQIIILPLLFILFSFASYAQNGSIEGRVFNAKNNEPLPFVNVVIFGTNTGVTSDIDGKFTFKGLKPGYVKLEASFVGFEKNVTSEFMVNNSKHVNVEIGMNELVVNLKQVEIKEKPFEKSSETPLSMQKIGIQEIEKSAGGNRDISKIVQSLPGVGSTLAFRNDVIVRGGSPSENKFYLDDVEIPNLNHFATQGASGGPAGIINVDLIREVEFLTGSFPANKGNMLSSLFDMKQIDGNKDHLHAKGAIGASDVALSLDGPIGKKSTFLFSIRQSYLQLLFSLLELPFLPTYNDAQFKYRIMFDKKNQLTVIGLGALDRNKLNLKANKTDSQKYILSTIPVNNQWNYALGTVYKHFRKDSYDTWVLSRNMLRNKAYKYYNNDESSPDNKLLDYVSDEIENKFRYEYSLKRNGFSFSAGAGLEYAKYTNDTYQKFFISNIPVTLNYHTLLDLYKWNVFAQVSKAFFGERLALSFGVRSDANSYSAKMSSMLNQISPRLSGSYSITEKLSLNFNVGRYYQQPAYTTMGFRDTTGDLVNKTNGLKYISADHAVLGLAYQDGKHFQVTLEGFYKNYRNYPFSINDSVSLASKGADFDIYGNEAVSSISKGRAYGAELLFRIKMLKGFNVLLAYTYVRSEFTGKNNEYIPSSWDNRNLLNIVFSKNFKGTWDVGFKWKLLGGAPYTPYDLEGSTLISAWNVSGKPFLDYSAYNSKRVPLYQQLDIRLDKTFFFKKWSLDIYVDVQNVTKSKAIGQDNYILQTDDAGNALIDPSDASRYELKPIKNESSVILPTIGLIIEL